MLEAEMQEGNEDPGAPSAADLERTGLTFRIALGSKRIEPHTTLKVVERCRGALGSFFLALSDATSSQSYDFSLRWLVSCAGSHYVILTYPAELTAESDIVPRIVLRVGNEDTLLTFSPEELYQIAPACIAEIERGYDSDAETVQAVLGHFSSSAELLDSDDLICAQDEDVSHA